MGTSLEDLRMLKDAETVADGIWKEVSDWDLFIRNTVGEQLVCAADSIGANIAEGYGRYHYGEKLRFLYYARGSLYETKYWLNRAHKRGLISDLEYQSYIKALTDLARLLNGFISFVKRMRRKSSRLGESRCEYHLPTCQITNNQ